MLFLDMDGVLCNFDQHVKDHLGGYCHEIGDEVLQREVPKIDGFWDTIPPMPDMHELWEGTKHLNPFVLTARASWDDRCAAAKYGWLAKHLPDLPKEKILVVRRSEKQNHAACPDTKRPRVLVDDFVKNTAEWSRAGGVPVLHTSARVTLNVLSLPDVRKLITA